MLPTENRPRYEKLSNEEQKIYQMIVTRFLGLFAEPHKISQTKITVVFRERTICFPPKPGVVVVGKPLLKVMWIRLTGKRHAYPT